MATALRLPERDPLFEVRAKRFLKETHSPETLEGVVWTKPPKGAVPVLVDDIVLDKKKRLGSLPAPCPICCPNAPKYYQGALAWFPDEGVYRCIGIECIARLCGVEKAYHVKRNFDLTKSLNSDYEFAFNNILIAPVIAVYLEALLPVAEHVQMLRNALGKSKLRGDLWKLYKSEDGQMRVWEVQEVEQFNPRSNAIETKKVRVPKSYGPIDGSSAIVNELHLVRDLRVHLTRLSLFCIADAQSRVLDSYNDHISLSSFRRAIFESQKLRARVEEKTRDVLAFFDEDNFRRLQKFGDDSRSALSICASTRNGLFKIGPTFHDSVSIRPDFAILDNLPPWPAINSNEAQPA